MPGLAAELAYGVEASYTDPVRYSFAHGGKDGFPFPVNEADIENSYTVLNRALRKSRAGQKEQLQALKNLAAWHNEVASGQVLCTPNPTPRINTVKPTHPANEPGRPDHHNHPSLIQPQLF